MACLASWAGWLVLWLWLWGKKRGKGLNLTTNLTYTYLKILYIYICSYPCLASISSSEVMLPCKLLPWLHPLGLLWLEVWSQVGGGEHMTVTFLRTGFLQSMERPWFLWFNQRATPEWSNNSFSSSRFYNEVAVLGTTTGPELLRWLCLLGGKKSRFS